MFDNTIDKDEEKSFAEAYRSEILDKGKEKEKSILPKLISILLSIVVISVISIFGYNYLTGTNKSIPLRETKQEVSKKVEEIKKVKNDSLPTSMMIDHVGDLEHSKPIKEVIRVESTPTATNNNNNINHIANQIKLEISKELDKENGTSSKKIESTPIAPQKGEEIYMEKLRELSKQIDREAI